MGVKAKLDILLTHVKSENELLQQVTVVGTKGGNCSKVEVNNTKIQYYCYSKGFS
jgi:hypothetical protein